LRRIHADDANSAFDEVPGDGLSHPAAHVENRPSDAHVAQKSVQPRALLKRPTAIAVVHLSIPLVEIDDGVSGHSAVLRDA
jgi:hypothetical protein